MPRWIDSFLFNGEAIVKMRLAYLYPHVDKFYVTEQRYTFQGNRKDSLYIEQHKGWFAPYLDKLVFLVDEKRVEGDAWKQESSARNLVAPYLLAEQGEWFCTVCDVDEIPDVNAIQQNKGALYTAASQAPVLLSQDFYYYNFNWYIKDWVFPFVVTDKTLQKPLTLQQVRDKQCPIAGALRCGWHFSYCMSLAEIQRKLESFSHTEYNTEEYKSEAHIADCIRQGKDLFKRTNYTLQWRSSSHLPNEFREFEESLKASQTQQPTAATPETRNI